MLRYLLILVLSFTCYQVSGQWQDNRTDYKRQNEQKEKEYKKRFAKNTNMAISRNVLIAGLQLGGSYILGIEYEYRINDLLGVALGIGYPGYEAGVKLHFKPTKHGQLLFLNYKDVYWGKESIMALEYGWNIPFRRANLRTKGFYFHGGLGAILYIDPTLRNAIYVKSTTNANGQVIVEDNYSPITINLGCGISF